MYRVPEESRLPVAFVVVRNPRPGGFGGRIVDRIISIGPEMANIFSSVRVNYQNTAVSIAVSDVQAIGGGIDYHIRRLLEHRRPVHAAVSVIAVWPLRCSADPHFEIAVHIKL